jgi:hypothetical protein
MNVHQHVHSHKTPRSTASHTRQLRCKTKEDDILTLNVINVVTRMLCCNPNTAPVSSGAFLRRPPLPSHGKATQDALLQSQFCTVLQMLTPRRPVRPSAKAEHVYNVQKNATEVAVFNF